MANIGLGITRYRWIPLIVGIIAIGLGIWCLCSPVSSVPVMAYIFAGLVCVAGIFNLCFAGLNHRVAPNWGWAVALGILDLVAVSGCFVFGARTRGNIRYSTWHMVALCRNQCNLRDACAQS